MWRWSKSLRNSSPKRRRAARGRHLTPMDGVAGLGTESSCDANQSVPTRSAVTPVHPGGLTSSPNSLVVAEA
jgi:hypothetical protein